MDPQERMNLDGSLTYGNDSSESWMPAFMNISSPNEKAINTDEDTMRLSNLDAELQSSTETNKNFK